MARCTEAARICLWAFYSATLVRARAVQASQRQAPARLTPRRPAAAAPASGRVGHNPRRLAGPRAPGGGAAAAGGPQGATCATAAATAARAVHCARRRPAATPSVRHTHPDAVSSADGRQPAAAGRRAAAESAAAGGGDAPTPRRRACSTHAPAAPLRPHTRAQLINLVYVIMSFATADSLGKVRAACGERGASDGRARRCRRGRAAAPAPAHSAGASQRDRRWPPVARASAPCRAAAASRLGGR